MPAPPPPKPEEEQEEPEDPEFKQRMKEARKSVCAMNVSDFGENEGSGDWGDGEGGDENKAVEADRLLKLAAEDLS